MRSGVVCVNYQHAKVIQEIEKTLALRFRYIDVQGGGDIALDGVELMLYHHDSMHDAGLDVLEGFKRSHPSTPIILTSNMIGSALGQRALRMRVWDFILLPQEGARLIAQIRCILAMRKRPQASRAMYRRKRWSRDRKPR
ncbi:MAG: hypothetical protein AABY83_02855 [Pseudomonadota bacterium]